MLSAGEMSGDCIFTEKLSVSNFNQFGGRLAKLRKHLKLWEYRTFLLAFFIFLFGLEVLELHSSISHFLIF